VPSLDTSVCDMETRRFNVEAGKLGEDVAIVAVSMDLPFAQKRWCGTADVKNVQTLSDHRDAAFGQAYGVLIKDLRLLARAVFVVDKQGVVRYVELVKEVASEPNYEAALDAARKLL
jgi:thiol peroxidase